MQNIFKKIVSLFFCISILISVMCVPASAADDSSIMQDFWEWNVQTSRDAVDVFWKAIYGDDWLQDENRSKDELEERYNQYVSDLQTDLGTTILIDGGIRYYFDITDVKSATSSSTVNYSETGVNWSVNFFTRDDNSVYLDVAEKPKAPCAGSYTGGLIFNAPAGIYLKYDSSDLLTEPRDVVAGNTLNPWGVASTHFNVILAEDSMFAQNITVSGCFWVDFYPIAELTQQSISINSRPSSITGDYGILGDDGTIIKVDKTIVDEGHSFVYNPITNTTYNYTDYAYDYSDRSYNLTLEDGSTMKVVYGDENITIQEGDTVYNVYYLMSGSEGGSGSGGAGDDGSGGIGGAIGGLFDVLGEIIYGLIEGTINLATKALSALTGLLDLLKQFGESIISFFGGYTDFLGAVFPFLPEETFSILNLGLILMIAAAVFKKFL